MRNSLCGGVLALSAAMALTGGGIPAAADEAKPYVIYLSNNFVGNDWRQQMERVAQVAADKAPLKGKVELHIENAEGTVQAQINSLNNIIREKPAAILIDASSSEALNPTIQKACDAGIVVVTFDQTVSADCAYKLHSDFDIMANNQAEWMAAMLGGKGKVLMDDGLAGAPISEQFAKNFAKAFAKYPGIEVVGHYNGNYALGPEQQGVAALLAAHPKSTASSPRPTAPARCRRSPTPSARRCRSSPPPSTAPASPAPRRRAPNAGSAPTRPRSRPKRSSSPSTSSAAPSRPTRPCSSTRPASPPTRSRSPATRPNSTAVKIELGKTVFPDLPPGLSLPISPDWVTITPGEAAGTGG